MPHESLLEKNTPTIDAALAATSLRFDEKVIIHTFQDIMIVSSSKLLARSVFQNSGGLAAAAGRVGGAAPSKLNTIRWMSSVINLSDLEATEKFKELNHKSVLYFTAQVCGQVC